MKRVKVLSLLITVCLFMTACSVSLPIDLPFLEKKSDEQIITERIEEFTDAYNSGDLDAVVDCMDRKTKNAYKAALGISNGLIGKLIGLDVSISDLFALGIGFMYAGDVMEISINDINIITEKYATVSVDMTYYEGTNKYDTSAYFTLKKEKDDWFISSFGPEESENNSNGSFN